MIDIIKPVDDIAVKSAYKEPICNELPVIRNRFSWSQWVPYKRTLLYSVIPSRQSRGRPRHTTPDSHCHSYTGPAQGYKQITFTTLLIAYTCITFFKQNCIICKLGLGRYGHQPYRYVFDTDLADTIRIRYDTHVYDLRFQNQ